MKDYIYWLCAAILVIVFLLTCLFLVKTMNANDRQFDRSYPERITQ